MAAIVSFLLQVLPEFYYTYRNRDDSDIAEVVDTIYNLYVANSSRCMGTEIRVESVKCLCAPPVDSHALFGYMCNPLTKTWDESQCVFSRCEVVLSPLLSHYCFYALSPTITSRRRASAPCVPTPLPPRMSTAPPARPSSARCTIPTRGAVGGRRARRREG
jgi:hypothetical protein